MVDQEGCSHLAYWAEFTRAWIQTLAGSHAIVWILWGKHAQSWKATIFDSGKSRNLEHAILESAHPSPLSAHRGFFGSKPFSRTNAELRGFGIRRDRVVIIAPNEPAASNLGSSVKPVGERWLWEFAKYMI